MAARTKLFEENSVYTWEVENYSILTSQLVSPPLYFLDGSKWELVLRPGIFHNFHEQDVIYIRRNTTLTTMEHRIRAKVWIRDKEGGKCHERSQEDIYISDGWNYLIWNIDKLVLERERDDIFLDDTLTVQCQIRSSFDYQTDIIDSETLQRTKSSWEKLVLDFSSLFENAEHSDVTLRCGESTLAAHRCILAARSEVFSAMFRHEMKEKTKGIVDIDDIKYDDLYKLLQYMYSCKLDSLNNELALRLYEVADKYAVETLKEECSLYLQKHLSTSNACDILLPSDIHGDTNLKTFVICFLIENKKFLTSVTWKEFCKHHTALCNEVLCSFVEVNNDWENFGMILS